MYEIKRKERNVDGRIIDTFQRDVCSCNIFQVEAGTNGYQGGDSGHGSRTFISIKDVAASDILVRVIPESNMSNGGVEIILGGDTELETMIRSLKFITKVLEDQVKEVYD